MIFETLYASARRGELILTENGFARYHLRRDGILTLHEILVTRRFCGVGTRLLGRIIEFGRDAGASCVQAKCPADLDANEWYRAKGFVLMGKERARSGREINCWRLSL